MSHLTATVPPVSTFDATTDPWATHRIPIDPLLVEPLDLHGSRAQRRHLVEALAEQLGLDARLHNGADQDTWQLLFDQLTPLAEVLDQRRVDLHQRAHWIAGGAATNWLPASSVVQAVIDLGWSHNPLPAGTVLETVDAIRHIYTTQMAARLLNAMRRWEKHGWLSDIAP